MSDAHEITGWPWPWIRPQPALTVGQQPHIDDLDKRDGARAETEGGSSSWQTTFHLLRSGPHRATHRVSQADHQG
jgi:hypothetical protein